VKLSVQELELHLRHTFRISRWEYDVTRTVLVTLEHEGLRGYGEVAPPRFFGETNESTLAALQSLDGQLDGDPTDVEAVLAALPPEVRALRGAVSAIDIALHDLAGQMAGQPLWELFGADPSAAPVTSFTIAIASVPEMQERVREAERYPILKVKVGTDRDLEILDGIRAVTDKPLRVDANAHWSVNEAIVNIRAMEAYGIQFIEQPIPTGNIDGLRRIRDAVGVPLIVDEDVATGADIEPLADAVDGINIKLAKCGGLAEARRMIGLARGRGLAVMLGCHIESSVAITAAAHLSPLVDLCDLDGNVLITDDPFTGATLDGGARIVLPTEPGLGVVRSEDIAT
jgi:L-alanine-DL-glutamate epimerase-like enolase superfamily enzyme